MILQIFKNPVQKGEALFFFLLGETVEADLFHFIYNALYAICNIVSLFGKKDLLDPDSVFLQKRFLVHQVLVYHFIEEAGYRSRFDGAAFGKLFLGTAFLVGEYLNHFGLSFGQPKLTKDQLALFLVDMEYVDQILVKSFHIYPLLRL